MFKAFCVERSRDDVTMSVFENGDSAPIDFKIRRDVQMGADRYPYQEREHAG